VFAGGGGCYHFWIMRLISYNIHKGIGGRDRRYSLQRVIEVIGDAAPDLVCLQEVDRNVGRSHHHDQPRLLAERLGMPARLFQFNVPVRAGGYGNLILSRWPIRRHHQVSLRLGRRKPRGGQIAVVETPEGPLCVVNWHLGLSGR
jgi:endonuclease/exonuclease/phosphatase family metal-dependent hydrolase